jgi:O-methyltransferase involved in polyketide biosynthesis
MADDVPTGVGTTAVGVAVMRMAESARPDRLFEDPLAGPFVAAAGWRPPDADAIPADRRGRLGAMAAWVSARTRFLDDLLLDATGPSQSARRSAGRRPGGPACVPGAIRQVVVLGAGLDARAFRLRWPAGVRLFEVDTPEMLSFKQRVLDEQGATPRCERIAVAVDLRDDWPAGLRTAGFDPGAPVAWVIEGLLVYLAKDSVDRLMRDVASLSGPGSRMAITASSARSCDAWRSTVGNEVSAMWISALPAAPEPWLEGYGWSATAIDARDKLCDYGRPAPPHDDGTEPTWLIDALRA